MRDFSFFTSRYFTDPVNIADIVCVLGLPLRASIGFVYTSDPETLWVKGREQRRCESNLDSIFWTESFWNEPSFSVPLVGCPSDAFWGDRMSK